jgi:hypothetical protein
MTSKTNSKKHVNEKDLYGRACACDFLNFHQKQKYREGYKFKKVICPYCKKKGGKNER